MSAPSHDLVEAEKEVAGLKKKLEGVEKQLANLKKHVGTTTLGPDASWTIDKLTSDFPLEDFGVVWKKDEDTGRDPLGKLQARYESLEKREENLGERLVTAENRAKDLRDKRGMIQRQIYFEEWQGFPNGQGLYNHTALPLEELRGTIQKLAEKRVGAHWLESPMGTGKTGLAQLLKVYNGFDMVTVVTKDPKSAQISPDLEALDALIENSRERRIVIDEAQKLSILGIEKLRLAVQDAFILCCGVPNTRMYCEKHEDPSATCKDCFGFKCCNKAEERSCKGGGPHSYVASVSRVIDCKRTTVDSLVAPKGELEKFLQVFSESDCDCPRFSDNFAADLIAFTGGLLGWTMHVLQTLCKEKGQVVEKNSLTREAVLAALGEQRTGDSFKIDDEVMWEAAVTLLTGGTLPADEPRAIELRKLSVGKEVEGGHVAIRSPAHRIILKHVIPRSSLVTYERGLLDSTKLVDCMVLQLEPSDAFVRGTTELRTEDALNSALGNAIKVVTATRSGQYDASEKVKGNNRRMVGVPDHVITLGDKRTVVEVMILYSDKKQWPTTKSELTKHVLRFNKEYGSKKGFAAGVLVCFSVESVLSDLVYQTSEGKKPATPLLDYLEENNLSSLPANTAVHFVELYKRKETLAFKNHKLECVEGEYILPLVENLDDECSAGQKRKFSDSRGRGGKKKLHTG